MEAKSPTATPPPPSTSRFASPPPKALSATSPILTTTASPASATGSSTQAERTNLRILTDADLMEFTNGFKTKLGNTGSFGGVYKGNVNIERFLDLTKSVVVNVSVNKGDREKIMWMKERTTLNSIIHENVIRLFGYGEGSGYYALVYDCAENDFTVLKDLIVLQVVQALLGATKGIQAMHSSGYIHWDVKLANILVTKNGIVKLGDFGFATRRDERMMFFEEICGNHVCSLIQEVKEAFDIYCFGSVIQKVASDYKQTKKYCLHYDDEWLEKIDDLQARCLSISYRNRPHIEEVVQKLKEVLDVVGARRCLCEIQ